MPQRRPHWSRPYQPRFEQLEDRSVPAVVAAIDGAGLLTVTLGAASDESLISGTLASGTDIKVTDVAAVTSQSFTGVTGIVVVDGGSNATQKVTFSDEGAGTALNISGAITVTGVETVDFATPNGAVRGGSVSVDGAADIRFSANVTTSGNQTFNNPATLTATNVTLASTAAGDIRFGSTVTASTSGANSLAVNTSGVTTFAGVVGATPLGGLTTDAGGSTNIRANISTIGAQVYNDPVVLSGPAITITSTVGAILTFNGTVDGEVAGATALTMSTSSGTTTFGGDVGVAVPLGSITTDTGGGNTVFGSTAASIRSVITQGAQTYNDPVRLNAASVTFSSTAHNNITFNNTVNATNALTSDMVVNTGGLTSFNGAVGGVTALKSLTLDNAGQDGELTIIRASITTSNDQQYGDTVTFDPNTGILSQTVSATESTGDITFLNTFGSASTVPVTIKAGADVTFGGNGVFNTAGSRLNVQAGSSGTGALHFSTGLTFRADTQTWQAGDGNAGNATTATIDLLTNAPAFRDSTNNNSPRIFVLRQDGAVVDETIPAAAQFGPSLAPNYTILSDDSTLTLNKATTALAGSGTANLTLGSSQAMSLGVTISAPAGVVRLRSTSANVTQTGGSISAAGLGVRSGTATSLVGNNNITSTFAAVATTTNIEFRNGAAYSVGVIGADPLSLAFISVTGVTAGGGTVTFSQHGTSPLNLTIAAPVSGSTITATGGTGNDIVNVNYTLGGSITGSMTFTGNGGNDTLNFTDAGSTTAHTYTVGANFLRDTNAAVSYTDVDTVTVTGGSAADTFTVTPDALAAISVTGGLPTGTAGDKMTLVLTGATTPNLTATKQGDGFQGTATFGNRAGITFNQMESIAPQADVQVTATVAPALVPVNGSTTFTVIVKNNGPDAATGITFDDVFPASLTANWTAVASAGSTVAATSGTGSIHTTMDLLANGTVTFTIIASASNGFIGTVTHTPTAGVGTAAFDSNTANNSTTISATFQAAALTAVAPAAGGGPNVKVYNADGSIRFSFFAYDPSYTGGVTVATGDINADGVEDIVTGSALGASHVKVFDGASGSLIASFFAFPGFSGGVNVAVAGGDVIVGAGNGGGPVFAGYHVAGGSVTQTFSQFAYDPNFRGGVQVAGSADLIAVGAGPTGSSHIKVFDASTRALVSSFFAFPATNTTGVNIAMGKSGSSDTVIVGAGAGSPPAVVTVEARTGHIIGSVLAFDPGFTGGVRVATTTTPTGQAGTVYGAGPTGSPRVRIVGPIGSATLDFFAFDPSFTGGIYVG